MRWRLPGGAPATARRGLLLCLCLLLEVARYAGAFLLPAASRCHHCSGGNSAVRAFLGRGQQQQQQRPGVSDIASSSSLAAVMAEASAVSGPSSSASTAARPSLSRRGYTRRRPRQARPGGGVGSSGSTTTATAATGSRSATALSALLAPEYDIIHVAGDVVAGFVGGAVGVVGTMVALEVKMRQVNERSKCPYCSGSGQLTCARCYGQQTVSYRTADGQIEQHPCPSCLGAGTVTCINCKGDGLAIPVMLDKTKSRDPETRLEEYGMG